MRIELILDSREGGLHQCVTALVGAGIKGVDVAKKSMDLGDVQILLHHNDAVVRTLVFERKTLPDLVSSIHDGRYREQKARLLATHSTCNLAYIVEGDSLCASLKREPKNISSAYTNIMFRDNIRLIFTASVQETAETMVALCRKILDKPSNYLGATTSGDAAPMVSSDYTQHLKLKAKKNHNITPQNCFILQLSQVPTISSVVAKNIIAVYPTVAALVGAMAMRTTTAEKIKILSVIKLMGKIKAAKLVEYMHL